MTAHTTALTTRGLTKAYGPTAALRNVSITVPAGSVYGLVGPNGAGKTTLLSILAGLRSPTSGDLSVASSAISVLPDTPQFDRWLTGREVVELSAGLAGADVPAGRIDEVIAQAGLDEAAHRRVGGYSRGMLQRLGLASTVVSDPELILLDEPAAALDPRGRREVLDLVTELRGRATVVFSSHILDDVQEVCDTIGILTKGELVFEGPLERLLTVHGTNRTYRVETSDPGAVVAGLVDEPWVDSVKITGQGVLVVGSTAEAIRGSIVATLGMLTAPVTAVIPVTPSLEDIFLEVTR